MWPGRAEHRKIPRKANEKQMNNLKRFVLYGLSPIQRQTAYSTKTLLLYSGSFI